MPATASSRARFARRRYLIAAACLIAGVALTGWLLNAWMTTTTVVPLSVEAGPGGPQGEFDAAFREAVASMQAGRYQEALSAWHRALLLDAGVVEVKVNLGFTLFELGQLAQARDFFIAALEQNAYQANAYYGLAIVSERMGDLEGALGAMRSFIHLAGPEQDERHIRRARAALWEWEAQLAAADGDSDAKDTAPREQ